MKLSMRHVCSGLALLSLLPYIGLVVLWVRSYRVCDSFVSVTRLPGMAAYETADDTDLIIARGRACYLQSRCDDPASPKRSAAFSHSMLAPACDLRTYMGPPSTTRYDRFGFALWSDAWRTGPPTRSWRTLGVIVPL